MDKETFSKIKEYWTRSKVKSVQNLASYLPKGTILPESILNQKTENGKTWYQVKILAYPELEWVQESSIPATVIELFNNGQGENLWENYYSNGGDVTGELGTGIDLIKDEIKCNTDKETDRKKEKFKRHRTAGVQVFCCGCGVVLSFYENFRAETKAQMWIELVKMIESFEDIDWLKNCFVTMMSVISLLMLTIRADETFAKQQKYWQK